jgi:hypothetical protein
VAREQNASDNATPVKNLNTLYSVSIEHPRKKNDPRSETATST